MSDIGLRTGSSSGAGGVGTDVDEEGPSAGPKESDGAKDGSASGKPTEGPCSSVAPKSMPEGVRSASKICRMSSLKASILCGVADSPGNTGTPESVWDLEED